MHQDVLALARRGERLKDLVCAALACLALCASWPAVAQTSVDQEALRQRQRDEDAERRRREGQPDVRSERAPLDDSDDLPDEQPCFQIKEVRVEGAQRGFSWAQRWARRYQGRCIGEQGVNVISRRLTQRILA